MRRYFTSVNSGFVSISVTTFRTDMADSTPAALTPKQIQMEKCGVYCVHAILVELSSTDVGYDTGRPRRVQGPGRKRQFATSCGIPRQGSELGQNLNSNSENRKQAF